MTGTADTRPKECERRVAMERRDSTFLHETTHRLPGALAFVEPRQRERPVVLHSLAHQDPRVDASPARRLVDAAGVIEQELMLPREEQKWRQTRQVREDRRQRGRRRVRPAHAV